MKITHRNSTAKWSRTLANISLALCFICTPCLQASEVSEAYGRDEAAMWRAYYEGRWLDLATRTAGLAQGHPFNGIQQWLVSRSEPMMPACWPSSGATTNGVFCNGGK